MKIKIIVLGLITIVSLLITNKSQAQANIVMQVFFDNARINSDSSLTEGGVTFAAQKNGNYNLPELFTTGAFSGHRLKVEASSSPSGINVDGTDTDRFEYILVDEKSPSAPTFNGKETIQSFEFEILEPATSSEGVLIAQWWQGPGTTKIAPPVYLYVVKHASSSNWVIRLAVRNDDTGSSSSGAPIVVYTGTIAVGAWNKFELGVIPDWDGTKNGHVIITVNGVVSGKFYGKVGYKPNPTGGVFSTLRIKNGLYRPTGEPAMAFAFDDVSVSD